MRKFSPSSHNSILMQIHSHLFVPSFFLNLLPFTFCYIAYSFLCHDLVLKFSVQCIYKDMINIFKYLSFDFLICDLDTVS